MFLVAAKGMRVYLSILHLQSLFAPFFIVCINCAWSNNKVKMMMLAVDTDALTVMRTVATSEAQQIYLFFPFACIKVPLEGQERIYT